MLKAPTEGEDIMVDHRRLGLTLGRHPLALLRIRLDAMGMLSAEVLRRAALLPLATRKSCESLRRGLSRRVREKLLPVQKPRFRLTRHWHTRN